MQRPYRRQDAPSGVTTTKWWGPVGAQHATPCAVRTQRDASEIPTTEFQSLLWAEAKRGIVSDIYKPLVQLVLTIGRARTFDTYLPPPFLGVFDAEKIVFLPYKEIMPFFALNDFNWNVTPSDDTTREFGLLYEAIRASLALRARGPCGRQAGKGKITPAVRCAELRAVLRGRRCGQGEDHIGAPTTDASDKTEIYLYRYDAHAEELRAFIQQHFSQGGGQIQVNKNNFVAVYQGGSRPYNPASR